MARYASSGVLDHEIVDWSGVAGPGNRGAVDLGEGLISKLAAGEPQALDAPDLLVASARSGGQMLVLTQRCLRILPRHGHPFTFPIGADSTGMVAAGWFAWVQTSDGILVADILSNRTWKHPHANGHLLCARSDGTALVSQGCELLIIGPKGIALTQTLDKPAVSAVEFGAGTIVLLTDGSVYRLLDLTLSQLSSANGECRQAFVCDGRVFLLIRRDGGSRVVEFDPHASPPRIKDMSYPTDSLPVVFCRPDGPLLVTSSDGIASGLHLIDWSSQAGGDIPASVGTRIRCKLGLDARSAGKPDRAMVTVEAGTTWTLRAFVGGERRRLLDYPLGPDVRSANLLGAEDGFVLVHQIPGKVVVTRFVAER